MAAAWAMMVVKKECCHLKYPKGGKKKAEQHMRFNQSLTHC